jgi:hypothetical protein
MDLFFIVLWILSENYNTHETSKFNINICFIFQRKIFRNYFVYITRIFNGFQQRFEQKYMQVSKQSVTLLFSSCNEIWNRLDSLLVKIFSVKFYETPFSSFRIVTFRLADKCITHFFCIYSLPVRGNLFLITIGLSL